MVTLAKYGHNYNMLVMEIDGLSTATKPTDKFEGMTIPNGSTYTEIDTNTKYMFDAENKVWYKTTVNSGGGYSKDEVDALLADKADLDSSGLVPTSQIPPEVFERMRVVANDNERFALTRADVQNGDVVYVNEDEVMYYIYDDTRLSRESGYKPFAAGTAARAIADKDGNDIATTYCKPTSYATQNVGGTAKMWTTTENDKTTLHISTQ